MVKRSRAWQVVRRFPGTFTLMALTLLMFAAEHALGGGADLRAHLRLGALRQDRVAEHYELWRLVMPMFLHFGLIHLVLNSFALVQLGPLVESLWGTRRMVTFYVSTGIAAALASAAFTPEGYGGAVGASGAIMGLAGVLLGTSWYGEPTVRIFLVDLLGRRLLHAVLLTMLLGLGLWWVLPIVDNWGHFGGLVCGLLLAYGNHDPADRDEVQIGLSFLGISLTVLAAFVAMVALGGAAMRTIDIDTARQLAVRVSDRPGTWQSAATTVELLRWYDAAGASDEGYDVFARSVAKLDDASSLRIVLSGLMGQVNEGAWRDRELTVALERWRVIEPADPQALNGLAWHLVTRQDEGARDAMRAERLSRESLVRLPDEDSKSVRQQRASYLDTLGEVLYQQGSYEEALEVQKASVALATELELDELSELTERLEKIERAYSKS